MDNNINDPNLINLKEAAKISGYSADYIGQLIRAGKIPGKQVYSNIAWMTTAEAVLGYKNKSGNSKDKPNLRDKIVNKHRMLSMELNILKLFFKTFKFALPILIIVVISFILLGISIFYTVFSSNNSSTENIQEQVENSTISF